MKNQIQHALKISWDRIAPSWPLKNLIAVNPLQGFEDLPFEEAFQKGKAYFGQEFLPQEMESVNRETMKWLQAFFDEGQATIKMPLRNLGLFKSIYTLLKFDRKLMSKWKENLPENIDLILEECLLYLKIPQEQYDEYLTLMLTTLPGWASYIKYKASWEGSNNDSYFKEYMALRLLLVYLIYPKGKELLGWHEGALCKSYAYDFETLELEYKKNLLGKININHTNFVNVEAQLVFCIDVRSEGFRRAIESVGNYETFGFAGFFGIPVNVCDDATGEHYNSCPVLLSPAHDVVMRTSLKKKFGTSRLMRKIYQSLKYNITTPFALVESLGIIAGFLMVARTFFPKLSARLSKKVSHCKVNSIDSIPFQNQCAYALNALRMMGLVDHFAPVIVLCGHGSETQNNAYASSLDCGACGGRHGGINAVILASILMRHDVRSYLAEQNIAIPESTRFVAAEHNTTTDHVEIFEGEKLIKLKSDLQKAQAIHSAQRFKTLGNGSPDVRAKDWAQVRPEWGLSGNASFIVGSRQLTKDSSLEGRSFLHSYDWTIDPKGEILTTILTAPMVVAQWINAQYLFSTLDNVAFGGGSKITKNIVGKIGIMQGNSSDLMNGLPLQSVFKSDQEAYHEPLMLLTIVHAPRSIIDRVIFEQDVLQKLFGNEWVFLTCLDPIDHTFYTLTKDLKWTTSFMET